MNEAEFIGPLLSQLRAQSAFEVLVCDGGSHDETLAITRSYGATIIQSDPGRSVQLAAGAASARGDSLFFLHADTILPRNALELIAANLAQNPTASGSFCLAFAHQNPALQFYAFCSQINCLWTTYGDQGLFMTRLTYDKIGGFRNMALLEDVDIQKRARRHGPFLKLPESLITSPRRFLRDGVIMRQLLNIIIIVGYTCGVPLPYLAEFYRPLATKMLPRAHS
ncbi:MAG: TIGR04283 family arsenosugar biosynthesis glycosyltransferase [Proteobacteria bacterium]|nr:TIGR04283 family arsenosugar biosynthesis glycosyltransferase [Pseudomonadota bacterium]